MTKERIVLGLGDNIDYEIAWDSAVIERLIRQYGVRAQELDVNIAVDSERSLLISLLGFLQAGHGGERFVASPDIIERFAANFPKKITLGGTSVRAAIAMRKLGFTSALHLVTLNDAVRRLIPADIPYVCSNPQDSQYPHLIVQFGAGAQVAAGEIQIRADRANRIIYVNDHDNSLMNLSEGLADLAVEAQVFLISGFNAMHSRELLEDRLQTLLKILRKLPADALVFYEDAGFHVPGFNQIVHSALAGAIDIYSLNEDELQGYLGRRLDLLNAADVQQALAGLRRLIPVPLLVVHTMYWALAYGENAARVSAALQGGITMATARFGWGDDFTLENYRAVANLAPTQAGAVFAAEIEERLGGQVCCRPVAHIEVPAPTTVGLGDAFVGGFLPALLR